MHSMRLAILCSCYKDLALTSHRLKRLRKMNPGVPLFILYGGPLESAHLFRCGLAPFADDFYVFSHDWAPEVKWRRFDLLISQWFLENGVKFDWDSIALVQWDCLVCQSVKKLFSTVKEEELLLPGLRLIPQNEASWRWSHGDGTGMREEYLCFLEITEREYGNIENFLYSCILITACLPKSFLARYSMRQGRETGFLEYTIPTLAKLWGYHVRGEEKPFRAVYKDPKLAVVPAKQRALSPFSYDTSLLTILLNLMDAGGARIFHPCRRKVLFL